MIDYPKELDAIFIKLIQLNAKAIIVGGFVRDTLLKIQSKDIDIEVYGIDSFDSLETILKEFGKVNSVGKSFGVCKLHFHGLDLDFSLPRVDNKIASGHKGFDVKIDSSLDFKTATSRRDFTINAIGYDTHKKIILDPFNGLNDLKNNILKIVDKEKFIEDPLRVLRAMQFYARFHLRIDSELFTLCEKMVNQNLLKELPKDRIFGEIKKLLLKSSNPSLGFKFLDSINALKYFSPLNSLHEDDLKKIYLAIDIISKQRFKSTSTKLFLFLATLSSKFDSLHTTHFISNLTNDKKILKEVLILNKSKLQENYTDSQLYRLATEVNIELFLIYQKVIHNEDNKNDIYLELKSRAIKLNILNKKSQPFLQGRDLLALGMKASKEFSKVLRDAYEAQINLEITNYQEAKEWLRSYLADSR